VETRQDNVRLTFVAPPRRRSPGRSTRAPGRCDPAFWSCPLLSFRLYRRWGRRRVPPSSISLVRATMMRASNSPSLGGRLPTQAVGYS